MRAISIKQPWTHAIVTGRKRVENRSRAHPWRGAVGEVLAIHASASLDEDARLSPAMRNYRQSQRTDAHGTAHGAVLGTARLIDVHRAADGCCPTPYALADCWHLILENVRPLTVPIDCKGALGLWAVPAEVERGIVFQLTTFEEAQNFGQDDAEVLAMASATGPDLVEIPGLFDYDDEGGTS